MSIIPTPKAAVFEEASYVLTTPAKVGVTDDSLLSIVDYMSSYISVNENGNGGNIKLNIDAALNAEE